MAKRRWKKSKSLTLAEKRKNPGPPLGEKPNTKRARQRRRGKSV